jgi:hypothetical protein
MEFGWSEEESNFTVGMENKNDRTKKAIWRAIKTKPVNRDSR